MVMLPPMRWLFVSPSYGAWEQDNLHNWDLTRPLHFTDPQPTLLGSYWASRSNGPA